MASIAVKALAGLATAGTLGGGAYAGIYVYNNATTDTVENYLTKNGFTLIGESEVAKWTKVLEAYELEKKETDPKETAESIKSWCKSAVKKTIKSKEETDYEKATKLCVDFDNIKDKLGTKKIEEKEATLNDKLTKFPEAIQKEITKIQISESENPEGRKIKKWCDDNTKRRYLNDTEDYYKSINDHCLAAVPGG